MQKYLQLNLCFFDGYGKWIFFRWFGMMGGRGIWNDFSDSIFKLFDL
jgi:hypothetical protein